MRFTLALSLREIGQSLVNLFFVFFLNFFGVDTCPFWGPLVPLFWISGDASSGFQSQGGFLAYSLFCSLLPFFSQSAF